MELGETGAVAAGLEVRADQLARWRVPAIVAVVAVLGVIAVYFDTFRSIVSIWIRSQTYTHGFFVLPMSAYLIWEDRARLRNVSPRPDYRAIALLGLLGIAWLLSTLADVLVVAQYAAVASIPVVLWAVLGSDVTRRFAFALCFLLLAVPVGEALIPSLIEFTATFTVAALNLSGIPVLREANFLTLPNGNWSVVEACSGLRYLIASATIGLLYAHLTYYSYWRRAAFITLSLVVPILANGFRAFMIVTLGYLSDMKLAVGVDHLIYGWIFFGFVMLLLFWVGSLFRDSPPPKFPGDMPLKPSPGGESRGFVSIGVAALVLVAVWPTWAQYAEVRGREERSVHDAFPFPSRVGSWTATQPVTNWAPYYGGAELVESWTFDNASGWVGVHVAYYWNQSQGAELVNSANGFIGPDEHYWRQLARGWESVTIGDRSLEVSEALLDAPKGRLLAWSWYWVDGRFTASPHWAKIIEAGSALLRGAPAAASVTIFTDATADEDYAREIMTEFLSSSFDEIESGLEAMSQ